MAISTPAFSIPAQACQRFSASGQHKGRGKDEIHRWRMPETWHHAPFIVTGFHQRRWGLPLSRQKLRMLSKRPRSEILSMKQENGRSLGVVITGGTKGVGFALAAEFLSRGDRVVVCSRDEQRVAHAVNALKLGVPESELNHSGNEPIFGIATDVSNPEDVRKLGDFALDVLGGKVDCMINNAGQVGTRATLSELDPYKIRDVVATNLVGALLCCREAERLMGKTGGHCFTMDGAGSGGNATATYVAYGATKRAIPQMVASISKELSGRKCKFHVSSPGMVLTDLLLSGNADVTSRRFFNYLAEEPETVAADLAPRIRKIVLDDKNRSLYVRYLSLPRAFLQIALGYLFGVRANRHFNDKTGERITLPGHQYNDNGVRKQWRE